jgi:cytochrome c553
MFDFFKKKKEAAKAQKSADLRARALENMRGARERLGDDTIQQIAAILREKDASPLKQAEDKIKSFDKGRIADNLKVMIDDK